MVNKKKQSEDIIQHKKDANKTLKDLETTKCNIEDFGGRYTWETVVETRKKYINAFLASLDKQEKEFEHFK